MRKDSAKNTLSPNKRIAIAAVLIVLAVGYVIARPTLERWLGIELPALVDDGNDGKGGLPANPGKSETKPVDSVTGWAESPASGKTNPGERSGKFELEQIGRDTWRSPAGLVYTMGPNREHRIDHILRHAVDDPERRGPHGVFLPGDRDSVLQLIDDAWEQVKAGGRGVQRSNEEGKTVLTVDLGKTIGYVGGAEGADDKHPRTTRMKLVVDGDRVITAYPTWPRRR